jgi:hypothetical protein
VSAIVDATVLWRATAARTPVHLLRPLVAPVAVGIASATAGWLVADAGGADLISGLGGGACSVVLFLGGLLVFRGALLRDTSRFALESLRGAWSRGAAADVA